MVLAPEHPYVSQITTKEQQAKVQDYVEKSQRKSEIDRKANTEKTGVFTGAFALHPVTQKEVPIWIADYVLMDYGTGAIMAVPAHDERDFEFATQFEIPIVRVLKAADGKPNTDEKTDDSLPFTGDGSLCNSDFLDNLEKEEAIERMISFLKEKSLGEEQVQYKLRDWLFSRQRYWGEPFPIVDFSEKGLQAVPTEELPVLLPQVANYEPSEKGEPPLARVEDWVNYTSKDGSKGLRNTDTMPGSAGSSWYFLRYIDPQNAEAPFDFEKQKYWMPVDLYLGGPEHTVGHLLYSRFWQKVLFDCGLVSHDEPFQKLIHQGMVLGPDGEKMSKSRGNVINPDDVREKFGADAARVYITFLGPLEKDKPWSENGIDGSKRFLDRVWRLVVNDNGELNAQNTPADEKLLKSLHKTIKKVTEDLNNLSLNTAISSMMILVNELYKTDQRPRQVIEPLLQLLAPFAPHLCEELWSQLGHKGFVSNAPWPQYDSKLVVDDLITMGVQVNGKMRGTIELPPEADEETAVNLAKENNTVAKAIDGKTLRKIIYRQGKILNLIAN